MKIRIKPIVSFYICALAAGLGLLSGCRPGITPVPVDGATGETLQIYPDYTFCRLPRNIAPCNFRILTAHTRYRLEVQLNGDVLHSDRGREVVQFPLRRWKRWLQQAQGDTLYIALSLKQDGQWREHTPFALYIDSSAVSPYLTYRLIEPTYQLCHFLTIEERCIENFNTRILFDNIKTDLACVNCHTVAWGNPTHSLYHVRFEHPGTYIVRNGRIQRVNLLSERFSQGGVYPAWHPEKRYIAFGTAKAIPVIHAQDIARRTEVFDSLGDIFVYDIERNVILSDTRICTVEKEETFPTFSPDGRRLYFCQSLTPPQDSLSFDFTDYTPHIHYSLVSIEFDAQTGTFGRMDTLVDVARTGSSVSFPRVSPDGRFLVFCLSDHGTFPIRHPDSDLYCLDLAAPERGYWPLSTANSDQTESYHEFCPAGNDRWLIFSSKRDDGMYARPYFCLLDDNGQASKPFMLPQKHPDFYLTCLQSFNVPVPSNGPAPYDVFTTARACKIETIYPVAVDIAGETDTIATMQTQAP